MFSRFKPGDRVRMVGSTGAPYAGVEAVVVEIKPHPRDLIALAACIVVFSWGEKHTFWDAELELVSGGGRECPAA
jgi:hypothetical protein